MYGGFSCASLPAIVGFVCYVRTAICWYPASDLSIFVTVTVWFALSDRLLVLLYILLVLYGGDAEDRSGEAVHITMMLQVIEQEEVQQVQIVALLGRVVLPIDRRRR